MDKYVAYIRVSTARQGRSGLGIEAQRQRIVDFVGSTGDVIAWYEEHESGAKCDRPQLELALTACELTGATLLVATLDRLSRDVMFLETVKRRCVDGSFGFTCADMPDADSFTLGIMAQVAQYERQRISDRTRAALHAAKARGVRLGCPLGSRAFRGREVVGRSRGAASNKAGADNWAEKRRDLLADLISQRLGYREMAKVLTKRGITSRRGGKWDGTRVRRMCLRLGLTPEV